MNSVQMTTSAAFYFHCEYGQAIPLNWLERAVGFFGEHDLSPILFTAGGGSFELDDCFVLADSGRELVAWGDVISAGRAGLLNALEAGEIHTLGLDSPRSNAKCRSDWTADAGISSIDGTFNLGIDEQRFSDPVILLRRAYEIAKGLFDVRYGIAYKMPLAQEPASYAIGSGPFPFADFQEWMRLKREGIARPKSANDLWRDELSGKRRHLQNLFRGAYPASILTESHVRAAALDTDRIGRLSQLDSGLWLWELSEDEIPEAESMLAKRRLLVTQSADS